MVTSCLSSIFEEALLCPGEDGSEDGGTRGLPHHVFKKKGGSATGEPSQSRQTLAVANDRKLRRK